MVYYKIGGGYSVFCNPPYSDITRWCEKVYIESQKPNTTIVLLIPSRTDTKYFHKYICNKAELKFIKGRVKFSNSKYNAPFPSLIAIYKYGNNTNKYEGIEQI